MAPVVLRRFYSCLHPLEREGNSGSWLVSLWSTEGLIPRQKFLGLRGKYIALAELA